MFAKFEIRQLDLPAARKILGAAIGMCPKEALFRGYIDLEVEVCSLTNLSHTPLLVLIVTFIASRVRSRPTAVSEISRGIYSCTSYHITRLR